VRKPDVRFYEIACETAGVEPTEVVFLDVLERAEGCAGRHCFTPDLARELASEIGLAPGRVRLLPPSGAAYRSTQ